MNNSKKNPEKENEVSHRAGILKDIINDVSKSRRVKFCTALSINPVKLKIHGDIFLWQRGKEKIEGLTIKYTPSGMQKIIDQVNQPGSDLIYEVNPDIFPNFLASKIDSAKHLIVIPFFTSDDRKLLGLLFIGYDQSSYQKTLQSKIRNLTKHYEYSLEETWLVGKYKVIADIGKKINETLEDYQHIFDELLEKASFILDTSYYFLLATYNSQSNTFDKYEYYKYNSSPDKKGYRPQQPFKGSLKLALDQKSVIAVFNYKEDVTNNPKLREITFLPDGTPDPQSIIFIPLLLREDFLGVLSIQHEEPNVFNWEDVRMMELLGNQVSQALNSIRLYRHLEDVDLAITQLISPLSQEQSRVSKTKGILSKLVDTIKESTRADLVVLFPYSSLLSSEDNLPAGFEEVRIAGELIKQTKEDLLIRTPDDMACLILRKFNQDKNYSGEFEEKSELLYSKLNGSKERKGCFEQDEQIKSCVAMPLKIEDDFVGALFINFRKSQTFSDLQKLHIATLVKFAALSIRIQRDFFSSKQKYLQAFKQIDSFIGKDYTLEEVMREILKIAVEISEAVDSAIYLYEPQHNILKTSAIGGPHQDLFKDISIQISEGKGLVTKAFLTRQPQMDNNVLENPDYLRIIEETIGELDVPLIDPDTEEAIGVISLESTAPRAFQNDDKEFLTSIASQAALAIKVAQAKEKSTQAVAELSRQIKTMKDRAFNIIKQQKDVEKEIQAVLDDAREITGAEYALLQLYENGKPTSYIRSITTDPSKPIAELEKIMPEKERYGIINWVAENKKSYNTNNTDEPGLYQGSPLIKSELAVPLEFEGEVYAVLDVESVRYNAFNQEHINTLTEFAILAVLVAQTANRAIRAKQDIEKEKKRFKLLHQSMFNFGRVDYFAPKPKRDIETEVYEIVVNSLIEFRDEGEMIIRRLNKKKTSFELVKFHNQYQKDIPDSIPYHTENGELASINGQAAESEKYIYVRDLDNRPPEIVEPFSDSTIKCIVVVPIKSGLNNYGNLIWSHTEKNFFDESDILLIRGLAAQLGGSLSQVENAARSAELETFSRMVEPVALILHTLGNRITPIKENFKKIVNKIPEEFQSDRLLKSSKTKIENGIKNLTDYITELKDKVSSSIEEVELIKTEQLLSDIDSLIDSIDRPQHITILKKFADVSGHLLIDLSEITEIIELLIGNAIDVMPEGGSIVISAFQRLNYLIIEVTDTGPGVPEQIRDFIFVPGYTTKGGTGLGLCLSKGKALRNFGDLYLDQSVKGAKFVLQLPLAARGVDL